MYSYAHLAGIANDIVNESYNFQLIINREFDFLTDADKQHLCHQMDNLLITRTFTHSNVESVILDVVIDYEECANVVFE